MGKPDGALEQFYKEYDVDGVSVWVDTSIDVNAVKEIKIGHRKFLFWNELTLSGVQSQVYVN